MNRGTGTAARSRSEGAKGARFIERTVKADDGDVVSGVTLGPTKDPGTRMVRIFADHPAELMTKETR